MPRSRWASCASPVLCERQGMSKHCMVSQRRAPAGTHMQTGLRRWFRPPQQLTRAAHEHWLQAGAAGHRGCKVRVRHARVGALPLAHPASVVRSMPRHTSLPMQTRVPAPGRHPIGPESALGQTRCYARFIAQPQPGFDGTASHTRPPRSGLRAFWSARKCGGAH